MSAPEIVTTTDPAAEAGAAEQIEADGTITAAGMIISRFAKEGEERYALEVKVQRSDTNEIVSIELDLEMDDKTDSKGRPFCPFETTVKASATSLATTSPRSIPSSASTRTSRTSRNGSRAASTTTGSFRARPRSSTPRNRRTASSSSWSSTAPSAPASRPSRPRPPRPPRPQRRSRLRLPRPPRPLRQPLPQPRPRRRRTRSRNAHACQCGAGTEGDRVPIPSRWGGSVEVPTAQLFNSHATA